MSQNDPSAPRRLILSPMVARSTDQKHRASTPLELLFDLCFVVAIAFAAASLHHHVTEGHAAEGLLYYLMVFFAIWWAWMNFTWFGSSYDNDDPLYRVLTLIQIAGALVLASGVEPASDGDLRVVTFGYAVMRLATVTQWLRAARSDPAHRSTAIRYAALIFGVQVLWLGRLLLPDSANVPVFVVLMVAEIMIPVVAERRSRTTWHAGHIAERYGLFTIIVLGESVTAATSAMKDALAGDSSHLGLLGLAAVGLIIMFAMWWLYFDRDAEGLLTSFPVAIRWGYAHYFLFAAVAAVGAGLEVSIDYDVAHLDGGHGGLSAIVAGFSLALPVAVFLLLVWVLHVIPRPREAMTYAYPAAAVAILLTPFSPVPVHLTALICAALVVLAVFAAQKRVPLPA